MIFKKIMKKLKGEKKDVNLDTLPSLGNAVPKPELDICHRLKKEENLPLIAEMRFTGKDAPPIVPYDRFNLFAHPFFSTTSLDGYWSPTFLAQEHSSDFTINFPFRENTEDRGIDEMLFIFLVDGMVIDACNFGLPHVEMLDENGDNARSLFLNGKKWWIWGHPISIGCKPVPYGWASTLEGALENLSVQIYG